MSVFFSPSMKQVLSFLLILISLSVSARKTIVTSSTEINNGTWLAGDTIVMQNGVWSDKTISFSGQGTQTQPIVLMAETPGEVILNGVSKLSFSGKYIEVNGLFFKEGTSSESDIISFRTTTTEVAENCRLTNTAIDSYNPSLNTVDSKWVSLYGKNNKVDHCSFVNKNNSGTLLVVWLTSGVTVNHEISDNYFGYRNSNLDENGNELNGQEIIRVGDSSTSMTTANVKVSGNFFEHCNGEIEIISNKSSGNLYKNNLFLECHGMLTLRHGNNCIVDGNYFFGNGTSESGGVRIIGEDHKVYNNYFDNLRGTDYRSGICIVRGKENSALNEYFQVKNATVAFNTFINCTQAFSINYNSSSSLTLPPVNTIIENNHVYNTTTSSHKNVNISTINIDAMDVTWKNNLMNMGSYTNFTYNTTQVITGKDAKMTLVPTPISMYEPASSSELANYTSTDFDFIDKDIRGRDRLAAKIPGASQLTGIVSSEMPVKTDVGASFYNNPTTGTEYFRNPDLIKLSTFNREIELSSKNSGRLLIINLLGSILINKNIIANESFKMTLPFGVYIIQFNAVNGQKQTNKILL